MTSRERSARTKFYAVAAAAAAAALASLALVGTVGLTRREADRREPQGVPPSRPTAGIVGGGDAPSTEFPWMVTLYDGDHPDDFWDGHFCGGSLIAPTALLTAAHCVEGGAKPKAVVGAYNFSRADAGGASYTPERHTVKDVFIHPQYDGNFYDVAVLRLETASALPPLRIAEVSPALGTNVTVIGWGQTTAVPGYDWRDDDNSTHYWDDDIWPGWRDDDGDDDDAWYFEWYDDDYDGGPVPNVVLCPGLPAWASCDCGVPCGDQPTFCPCAEAVACCNGAAPSSGDDAGAEPMNRKTKLLRRHRAKGKKAPRPAPSKAKQAKPRRHAGRGHARAPKIAPGDDAAPSYKPSARPSYEQSSGTTAWDSGHGFCSSNLDGLVYAAPRDDCWAACEATYGSIIVAVDYWGQGYCYCQDDCQCMISDHGVDLITVDSITALPDACEYDDDYGWDYDDDYSYDFSSYGYNDDWYVDDDAPNVLQLVEVAVRDPEECVLDYLPGFDICAGDPPAEDSCYGDSGGPLLVREGDAWAQVGVVSRGEGCAAFPGLYADATALREWILSATNTPAPTSTPAPTTERAVPQPPARPTTPRYWGTGVGWCYSRLNKEIWATTPQDCWANCHAAYGERLVAVDFWENGNGRNCYCMDECQCMFPTPDDDITPYVITADSISELPEACGSYSYDFSYWYDDDATPPPTAQESSPVTPDDPLGLPEDSATAAPTAESDGALGRRLAWAAAACALAALLL